ncbi:MAG: class I SAM-dependent methyltransferase [Acidimicrobiia bacterium]
MDRNQPGYKGYKDYTPGVLRIYDRWVAGFMAERVWQTGTDVGLDLYRRHMGERHLDVGPGTGFFIAAANPESDTELTLLDANPHVLEHCAKTLAAWNPTMVEANVLQPLPIEGPFDSAALTHVIHCLPGPMMAKAPAIDHISAILSADGVLFGGTVLGLTEEHTWPARLFLRVANLQGGFDNRDDDVGGLRTLLERYFDDVEIDVSGSIAYFVAARPHRSVAN